MQLSYVRVSLHLPNELQEAINSVVNKNTADRKFI